MTRITFIQPSTRMPFGGWEVQDDGDDGEVARYALAISTDRFILTTEGFTFDGEFPDESTRCECCGRVDFGQLPPMSLEELTETGLIHKVGNEQDESIR